MSESEWANALQKFHNEAHAIRHKFALGLIARALVANQFQKQLLAAGFDADIVRKVVFSLVLNVFVSKK